MTADTIVDQMADTVVVLDDEDRVVDHNPSLAELVDVPEATGQHVDTILPGLRSAIDVDGTVTPPSGTERIYEPQTTPLYDHHDVYRGRLVVLRDVTLQRTRERTLEGVQSATERFLDAADTRTVAEIATETAQEALSCPYSGVVLYDDDAERLEPAALTDDLSALLRETGLLTDGGTPSPAWPARRGKLWSVFERGETSYNESFRLDAPDGDRTETTVVLFPLGDHGVFGIGKDAGDGEFDGEERRFARTLADATETALDRLERERELEASRREVEQRTEQLRFFNSALRHDLRNSVMVIEANLEFLSDHVAETGRSHFETVSRWVGDMTDLIGTVQSLTEAITGEDDHEHTTADLSTVLRERVGKVGDGHESVNVETDIPEDLYVVCDDLVGEVIENVLLNAVEHNDTDRPRIRVTATAEGDTVRVEIADNGPGIPEEFRGEVFAPGVTANGSGTIGFGLYFVKVMMEEYGGEVRFERNEPRGTVGVLTFPSASETEPAASGPQVD